MQSYISLEKLEAYKLARGLSGVAWEVYETLDWQIKKMAGSQFVESTDSTGANIAEGYGRFHYLDKVKFYYNARGSLLESRHWLDLLAERKLIEQSLKSRYLRIYKRSLKPRFLAELTTFGYKELRLVLNGLIRSAIKQKATS